MPVSAAPQKETLTATAMRVGGIAPLVDSSEITLS